MPKISGVFKNENVFHLLLLSIAIAIYFPLNQLNANTNVVAISLDAQIPFYPSFILVYLLFYPVMIFGIFYMFMQNKLKFLSKPMIIAFAISYTIYLFYPTAVSRQDLVTGDMFSQTLKGFYSLVNPVNVLPSLHVILIILIFIALYKENKRIGLILLPFVTLIALSTLFTKLHYILDVIAAIPVSIFSYLVYIKLFQKNATK